MLNFFCFKGDMFKRLHVKVVKTITQYRYLGNNCIWLVDHIYNAGRKAGTSWPTLFWQYYGFKYCTTHEPLWMKEPVTGMRQRRGDQNTQPLMSNLWVTAVRCVPAKCTLGNLVFQSFFIWKAQTRPYIEVTVILFSAHSNALLWPPWCTAKRLSSVCASSTPGENSK